MATNLKAARGSKRTCQNSECGSRFYDLNRSPIKCPICDSVYAPAVASPAAVAAAAAAAEKARKAAPVKKPEFELADDAKPGEAVEGDEAALADIETADVPVAVEDDETFLEEEEEDGGNVSGIIGGATEAEPDET